MPGPKAERKPDQQGREEAKGEKQERERVDQADSDAQFDNSSREAAFALQATPRDDNLQQATRKSG